MGGADEDRRGRAARRCAAQKEPRRRQGWAATGGRRERPRRTTATGGATADGREQTDGDVLLLLKKVWPRIRDGWTRRRYGADRADDGRDGPRRCRGWRGVGEDVDDGPPRI